jgi:imidazole glycerol phosphate synthase subunit HisF
MINKTGIKAAAAASIYHFTEFTPLDVKKFLKNKDINVRI